MKLHSVLLCLLVCSAAWSGGTEKDSPTQKAKDEFTKHVRPFLKKYCTKCHSGDKPKGDLDFTVFKSQAQAVKKRELWEKVGELLQADEMPPPKNLKPKLKEVERITDWIDKNVLD